MKRYRFVLIVFGICLALWAYTRFFEKPVSPNSENPIYTIDSNRMTQIEITEGLAHLTLTRQGNDWVMENEKVDSGKITSLLQTWSNPQATALEEVQNLKDFELSPPIKILKLITDSETKEIQVGRKTPVGLEVFVKMADAPRLYRIADYKTALISAKKENWKVTELTSEAPTPEPSEGVLDQPNPETTAH